MFVSLFEAFEAFQKDPRLAGVTKTWGTLADLPASTAPRICCVPTTDRYGPPFPVASPAIVGGKRVEVESIWTRWAGANLEIFVPAEPQGPVELEDLVRRVHLALRDTMISTGNYQVGTGEWVDRTKISENTLKYVQPVEIAIQIYDTIAAQICAAVQARPKRT